MISRLVKRVKHPYLSLSLFLSASLFLTVSLYINILHTYKYPSLSRVNLLFVLEGSGFSIKRIMMLEFSQYLENYLWPNFKVES